MMFTRSTALVGAVGLCCGIASANPLNLTHNPFPDIISGGIDVRYNAGSSALTLTGFALAYENDGLVSTPAHNIFGGQFNINALVNNSGSPLGGTLNIFGSIPALSIPNQLLLTGTLTDFGFTTSGAGRLEFVFDFLGGFLAPAYLSQGPRVGVIVNSVTGFPYNFAANWDNLINSTAGTGSAVSNSGVVPAPGAGLLVALVGGAAAIRRRRAAVA